MKLSNKMKRKLKNYIKKVNENNIDWLQYRQGLVKTISELKEDNKILVVLLGWDCSNERVINGFIVDAVPIKVLQLMKKEQEFADGPLQVSIDSPSNEFHLDSEDY